MVTRPTGRIQITGLTPDEENLIKDAARLTRKTIREWAIYHGMNDIAEARWTRSSASDTEED